MDPEALHSMENTANHRDTTLLFENSPEYVRTAFFKEDSLFSIMEYKIVSARTWDSLTESINSYLSNGWKVKGGVCFSPEEGGYYLQSIVRSIKSEKG